MKNLICAFTVSLLLTADFHATAAEKPRKHRTTYIKDRIVTKNSYIVVELSDAAQNDGDIASLRFNNAWLLRNYRIVNNRLHGKRVNVHLRKGINKLVLVAVSTGRQGPTTAGILIHDGDAEHRIELQATKREDNGVVIVSQ